jgi:predicted 2-oxoglutarate/Fe(II)-dependent dioxygenase YbiX
MTAVQTLEAGDRVPPICGAYADGGFFSIEDFVGRTLILLVGDQTGAEVQKQWLAAFALAADQLAAVDASASMLLSMGAPAMMAHINPPTPLLAIAQPSGDLGLFGGRDNAPDVLVIDRNSRIARRISADQPQEALAEAVEVARRLMTPPSQRRFSAAPVLIVPNLLSPETRAALIETFENGAHEEGAMASIDADGNAAVKLEAGKKHRRDLVLTPDHDLHAVVIQALSERLLPEIKRAYQIDIAHADRILVVRYDETGGYFHRHRDNTAPQVAFRQFAVSLNLNTGDYEGGDLEFPEYDNDHYSPPAGAAVVFSASLMHAARPVTRGARYVLLTFLHDNQAEAVRQAYLAQVA